MGTKHVGVTTLTFQGHVTSSVMWPFDSQVAIFYKWSVASKCLSRAVLEIRGTKHIGVTTFTFFVTSSVTWPFDSQVVISYTCSIVTYDDVGRWVVRLVVVCRRRKCKVDYIKFTNISHVPITQTGGPGSDLDETYTTTDYFVWTYAKIALA